MTKLIVLLAVLLGLGGSTVVMTQEAQAVCTDGNYWVAPPPFGNDDANGDCEHPWATIQKAVNTLAPDQTAIVKNGTYSEAVQCIGNFGSDDGGSGPTDLVTFRAENKFGALVTSADRALLIDCDYTVWDGFKLTGQSTDTSTGSNVWFKAQDSPARSSRGNVLRNSWVTDAVCHGITMQGGVTNGQADPAKSAYENIVEGNLVNSNGVDACTQQSHGIYPQGVDNVIQSNMVYDNGVDNTTSPLGGAGIHSHNKQSGTRILYNTVAYNYFGIVLDKDTSGGVNTGAIVDGNIVANNTQRGFEFGGSLDQLDCLEMIANLMWHNGNSPYGAGQDYDNSTPPDCWSLNTQNTNDPAFDDGANRDLHVPANFNTGESNYVPGLDYDGEGKPNGCITNTEVGADENWDSAETSC